MSSEPTTDNRITVILRKSENITAFVVLILLALLPGMEIFARLLFRSGIYGFPEYTTHLVVWITFIGGMITSRKKEHLSLSVGIETVPDKLKPLLQNITALLSVTISTALFISSLSFIFLGFFPGQMVGLFPIRIITLIMPIGYLIIAIRFVTCFDLDKTGKIIASIGFLLGILFALSPILNFISIVNPDVPVFVYDMMYGYETVAYYLTWPLSIILIISAIFGTPLFIVLGGLAYVLFAGRLGFLENIPNEAYTMLTGTSIAAIPLFTLTGFILSESKAGERLVRLFRALFGWLPGGLAIMSVLVCTFFTVFTGASGVTILALGALLSYVMIQSGGYKENFTHGLLTSSGSIGLLFPPSLPIILYGVVAQTNIKHMFVGGIIPGLLMVAALSGYGVFVSIRNKSPRTKFQLKEAGSAVWGAKWEILMPVVIIALYFGGITTLVETGAVAVIYALLSQMLFQKDISFKDLPGVLLKSIPIIGGVLVILAVARGLNSYIVFAEIPEQLSIWVETHIHSKYIFLILLNIALLITGCLMDIFSAITVVVPLILPLGKLFGIHPVHLGIIFLANLELGYLTPPVGLNLFLASYRFKKPLGKIYRNVIPFFLILLIMVLLITYIPWFSTGLLKFTK